MKAGIDTTMNLQTLPSRFLLSVPGYKPDLLDAEETLAEIYGEALNPIPHHITDPEKPLHKCTTVWPVLPLLSCGCFVFLPYPSWIEHSEFDILVLRALLGTTVLNYDEYQCFEDSLPPPAARWLGCSLAQTMHHVVQDHGHTRFEMASFLAIQNFNARNVLDYVILRIRRCTAFSNGRTEDEVYDLTLKDWTALGCACKEQGATWWTLLDRQLWQANDAIFCQISKRLEA